MIEYTYSNGSKIMINPTMIAWISPIRDRGCDIKMVNGDAFSVQESYDMVKSDLSKVFPWNRDWDQD